MVAHDIQQFSEGRTKARAYFCYLFSKNIPNRLPSLSEEMIMPRLLSIKADLENCEGVYLLDYKGVQITPTFTANIPFHKASMVKSCAYRMLAHVRRQRDTPSNMK